MKTYPGTYSDIETPIGSVSEAAKHYEGPGFRVRVDGIDLVVCAANSEALERAWDLLAPRGPKLSHSRTKLLAIFNVDSVTLAKASPQRDADPLTAALNQPSDSGK